MAANESAVENSPIVVVGRIQGPYGIKGWVHVAAYTEPRDNLLHYRPWFIGRDSAAGCDWQIAEIEQVRPHKQGFVARLVGIDDRNAAEALKGSWLGIRESELPATDADEFYWRDLIGAEVIDQQARLIGRVTGLLETGAHDVLVVAPETGGQDVLIPFHRQYVLAVDLSSARIRVDWTLEGAEQSADSAPADEAGTE